MTEILNTMDPTLKTLWIVAIVSTLAFALQFLMSVIGIGDADIDTDFDTDADPGLDHAGAGSLLSIRSIVNFFVGSSWMGICGWDTISSKPLLALASIAMGTIMSVIFLYVSRQMMKLQSSGNIDINDSVGKICDVYLRIPPSDSGLGKVQISFNGSVHELDARTPDPDPIPTGTRVKVTQVIGQVLIVERI